MQTYMITLYKRLLADVCLNSEDVHLDAPEAISYDWVLIEAPKLDKEVLSYLEGNRDSNIMFPEWIKPLWLAFLDADANYRKSGNRCWLVESVDLLRSLRQLLVFCYKAEQEPTYEQVQEAEKAFLEADEGCAVWSHHIDDHRLCDTLLMARRIVGAVIHRLDWSEIVPSHGPGGIFPNRLPCEKSAFRTLYQSIVLKYPFDQYFCGIPSFWDDVMVSEKTGKLEELDCIVSKLTPVPKDSRGPRLISVHPAESIWIQQGQRRLLERAIARSRITRGRINFTDQTVNGQICLTSSEDRRYCTIDLKEASDRVSTKLVEVLFETFAYEWISCSRATHIKLTDGRVHKLEKWAPMGNALCFPVESLVFFSVVAAGVRCQYGKNCTDIYVFGDDIIVPTKYYDCAIRSLASVGLVPNPNKCFVKGFFRESCGVEAYHGYDITPLRYRKDDYRTLGGLVANFDLAKRLRQAGYHRTATCLYSHLRRSVKAVLGYYCVSYTNDPNAAGLIEYVDIPYTELLMAEKRLVYSSRYQCMRVRAWMVKGESYSRSNGEWYHLQDSLLRLERMSQSDDEYSSTSVISDRGTEYPTPYRNRLKYGWAGCLVTTS